jgi:uncharacterized protein YdhG (YjbR/CyaY superfamily)
MAKAAKAATTITVAEYLAALPADRRAALTAIRAAIRKKLPKGYEEGIQYGMIGYYIPLSRYPDTYNGAPLLVAALASQKNHMAVYLQCVYGDSKLRTWFEKAFRDAGKKLDMGKSCVRFRRLDDVPTDVIAEAISRVGVDDYIAIYEKSRRKS